MFKKFDSTSITGVKADEKFAIEGSSAYVKEKIVSELALQQEADRTKKESSEALPIGGRSILHGGKIGTNEMNANTASTGSTNLAMTSTATKFSPFRSQRNTSIGSVAGNNALAHNGMMQI